MCIRYIALTIKKNMSSGAGAAPKEDGSETLQCTQSPQ